MVRVMLYCILSCLLTSGLAILATLLVHPASPLMFLLVAVVAIVITIPLVATDAAKISNRLVGPFVRAHGVVRRIANREPVAPITIRDAEDWEEWFQDFNTMIRTTNSQDHETSPASQQAASVEESE